MAGWDQNSAEYDPRKLTDDEIWSVFNHVFSSKSRNTSSYKYGFLKSIIDNLYNVDEHLKLTFYQLFMKFAEIYWNLVLKYSLHQQKPTSNNRSSKIEQILHDARERYDLEEIIPFESLTSYEQFDIEKRVEKECSRYVIGALDADMENLFYSFSKKEQWIQINPRIYTFICQHQFVIEKLNYYEWARFLEKVNDDQTADHLLTKIDESSKRNNLSYYREILFDEFEARCFYCGKPVDPHHVDVDHFVPWSFVKDDQLWNMVLACPECNRRKNDRLPAQYYLDHLIVRNKQLADINRNYKMMRNYNSDKMLFLYNIAQENGYDVLWEPKRIVWSTRK